CSGPALFYWSRPPFPGDSHRCRSVLHLPAFCPGGVMAVSASAEAAPDQPGAGETPVAAGTFRGAIPVWPGKEIHLDFDIAAAGHLFSPALGFIYPRRWLHGATHCCASHGTIRPV